MALFIGLMSGTSIDAIDAALVEFTDETIQLHATQCYAWPPDLRQHLLELTQQTKERSQLHAIACLDAQVGQCFAEAALSLLSKVHLSPQHIRAIGSAGQTIYHCPQGNPAYTWQIGDPNIIAQLTGIPTVADFRRRDMAAGGQGAPLAPAFHRAFWQVTSENRIVVNIGGIANITVLPADQNKPVIGFDTGPGNALLDAYAQQQQQAPMDTAGQWAASGEVQQPLLAALLTDPYFAQPAPKSTGRDYFNLAWLSRHTLPPRPQDVQATLCQLTIDSIVQATLPYKPQHMLVCGGGAHNPILMAGLKRQLPDCLVEPTSAGGLDPDWVEAVSFAWLAKQRLAQQPNNLPLVTGAKRAVVLGSVYI